MTPRRWLALVALAHALAPLVLLGAHWAFGPDETVYLSQINASHPALYFSAPRARGATLLAAPVTLLTSSTAAVRVWVSALSGLGLWLAFRPWFRLVPAWVVPVAAAAFASLWTVTLYGFQVMPNEWVAFATVGACGALLSWFVDGRRRHLVGLAAALAVIGLLRPSDAGFAAVGLTLSVLLVRAPWRQRLGAVAVMAAGVLIGVVEWVVEAQTSYGGVSARVHAAQAEQGGSGLFWAGGAQARVLAGPLLCRSGCHADAAPVYRLWWAVAGALVLVAVVAAARRSDRQVVAVPVLTAVVVAAQYLLTVPYGAPRFLLPAYALLAVPVVLGARELVRLLPRPTGRRVATGLLAAVLVAAAAVQLHALTTKVQPDLTASTRRTARQAETLAREDVRGRCVVVGHPGDALQLAYALRCSNGPQTTATLRRALRAGHRIVWLRHGRPTLAGTRWTPVPLPGSRLVAYVGTYAGTAAADAG